MGNTKSTTRKYQMREYKCPIAPSGNKRQLTNYLHAAFDLLCNNPKFNLIDHVYADPKFVMYMIKCQQFSDTVVLPFTKDIDLIGCKKSHPGTFLAYDKSSGKKKKMGASYVLTNLVSRHRYHDISRILLKKLIKFKIISRSDAGEIWKEISTYN